MNYKKILSVIFAASVIFSCLSADDKAPAKGAAADKPAAKAEESSKDKSDDNASRTQLRELFKSRVKTNEKGDIRIVEFPEVKLTEIEGKARVLDGLTATFITYVDGDIDFVRLNKSMAKYSGAINKKGERKGGGIPISGLIEGINKYLSSKSMGLQKVNFSAVNFRQRLEDGVPILCWIASSNVYETSFADRTKEREKAANIKDWNKELRKSEIKGITKSNMFEKALCIGFNPATNEYLFAGPSSEPFWMLDKEIRRVLLNAYVLRY